MDKSGVEKVTFQVQAGEQAPRARDGFGRRWGLYASHLGNYMHRWILKTPWFTVRLHHILASDAGRDFHDHPFRFTSLILAGGYFEWQPCSCAEGCGGGGPSWWGPGSIVRRKATDLHRLELPPGRTAWTLVFTGPYVRRWGFQTAEGWVDFEEYERSFYRADSAGSADSAGVKS